MLKTQSWTQSAWKGEAALQHVVVENPRGQVMTAVQDEMDWMRFVRVCIRRLGQPPEVHTLK